MDYFFIITGLLMLFIGGEALVRGSVTISRRLGISTILIGVVVVGFGTSMPELLVSIEASLKGQPDIALGNVVGSNIANILLILGMAAVIRPILCKDYAIYRDATAVVIASILLVFVSYFDIIERFVGLIMLICLIGYLTYAYYMERKDKQKSNTQLTSHEHEVEEFQSNLGLTSAIIISILSIVLLSIGANLLIIGASNVARSFGISEAIIGLSLVAFGTSLPEIATAIAASLKKNSDVIIGNVLGSNLFNILSILGITALIKPIPVSEKIADFDILFSLIVAVIALIAIICLKKLGRILGSFFLCAYFIYILSMYLFYGI